MLNSTTEPDENAVSFAGFQSKNSILANSDFDLIIMLDKKVRVITTFITIHPEVDTAVCSKFNGSPHSAQIFQS